MRGRRSVVRSPKPGAGAAMGLVGEGEVTLMRIVRSGVPRTSAGANVAPSATEAGRPRPDRAIL